MKRFLKLLIFGHIYQNGGNVGRQLRYQITLSRRDFDGEALQSIEKHKGIKFHSDPGELLGPKRIEIGEVKIYLRLPTLSGS